MDPIQAKFYLASFELKHEEHSIALRGLISPTGITKVHFPTKVDPIWTALVGSKVEVVVDGYTIAGFLVKQSVEHGNFHEIRFRDISPGAANYLLQKIIAEGVDPGWRRKFPRIPIVEGEESDLPIPNLCVVRFIGQEIIVNVMNFTLGGIRIRTLTNVLSELRVGSVVHFDLIATNGAVMPNLCGEVKNIAIHQSEEVGSTNITRSFGLEFKDLDPVNERRYKDLIKEYCLVLQKKFG